MTPESYESIKSEWNKISNKEQRLLIYTYIKENKEGNYSSWMEFLQQNFRVNSQPQPGASPLFSSTKGSAILP